MPGSARQLDRAANRRACSGRGRELFRAGLVTPTSGWSSGYAQAQPDHCAQGAGLRRAVSEETGVSV